MQYISHRYNISSLLIIHRYLHVKYTVGLHSFVPLAQSFAVKTRLDTAIDLKRPHSSFGKKEVPPRILVPLFSGTASHENTSRNTTNFIYSRLGFTFIHQAYRSAHRDSINILYLPI